MTVTIISMPPFYALPYKPQDIRRVSNGFNSDWTPSGYRDVKVNPIVNQHLCEIQLHLRNFHGLKSGQHVVYEWARELHVTTEINAEDLFKNVSGKITEEMIRLAAHNWHGTRGRLLYLQLHAGQHKQAATGFRKVLSRSRCLRA